MANPLIMAAGSLRHMVTVEQPLQSKDDSFGGTSETSWTTVGNFRAAIKVLSVRDAYQSGFVDQLSHLVTLRWSAAAAAIAPGFRVVFGSRRFRVQNVVNIEERNRVLLIYALEVKA